MGYEVRWAARADRRQALNGLLNALLLRGLMKQIALLMLVVLTLSACEQSPRRQAQEPTRAVAVAPLAVAQPLRDQPRRFGNSSPEAASRLVTREIVESLRKRGARVMSAEEVRQALVVTGASTGAGASGASRTVPPKSARIVAEKFGADALLVGEITRWDEREGTAAAASRGASVTFHLALFDAPGGQQLWSTTFSHTQQPLSENVLAASQLPGRGSRWLSAEELARWGAQRTARQVPLN